jgi:hypothetical protein
VANLHRQEKTKLCFGEFQKNNKSTYSHIDLSAFLPVNDESGAVTLSSSYAPRGDALEYHGTGNFTFGYFGGLMDAATGLLYVGNGQYYDPSTGRFLTRHAKPDNTNPYVPWNPSSALFAPLALLFLLYSNKRKRSKWDTLVIMLLLGVAVTMSLAACGGTSTPPPAPQPTSDPNSTPTPPDYEPPVPPGGGTESGSGTVSGTTATDSGAPLATLTVTPTYCPPTETPTSTSTQSPTVTVTTTPMPIDAELAQYGVSFTGILGEWTASRMEAVRDAVKVVADRFAGIIGGSSEEAFKRVYGYVNFEWCDNCSSGYGITADDHTIKFDGMYSSKEYRAIRLVVHELGHLFDRKICAGRQIDGICSVAELDVFHDSARTDLENVWSGEYCGKYLCLSRTTHDGPKTGMYWGFAGGWQEWQFGATDDPGEVWADMFLGWVYNQWGNDSFEFWKHKRDYMNSHMSSYLGNFR